MLNVLAILHYVKSFLQYFIVKKQSFLEKTSQCLKHAKTIYLMHFVAPFSVMGWAFLMGCYQIINIQYTSVFTNSVFTNFGFTNRLLSVPSEILS